MTIDRVGNAPAPKQEGTGETAQIDRQIQALTAQMKRVKRDKAMDAETKTRKIQELQKQIAQLQERKAQIAQRAREKSKEVEQPEESPKRGFSLDA